MHEWISIAYYPKGFPWSRSVFCHSIAMEGIEGIARIIGSSTFVSRFFRQYLLKISPSTRCVVSNLANRRDSCSPLRSSLRCENRCSKQFFVNTVPSISTVLSTAWNVAGGKNAHCKQMWQLLAESLDCTDTNSADEQRRCRKVLISSHFPASVVMISIWSNYRLIGTIWNVNKTMIRGVMGIAS